MTERRREASRARLGARAAAVALVALCLVAGGASPAGAVLRRASQVEFSVPDWIYAGEVSAKLSAHPGDAPYNERPGGTIKVYDQHRTYGTFPADKETFGNANARLGSLPAGSYVLTADYSGDSKFLPSSTSERFTVIKRAVEVDISGSKGQGRWHCPPGGGSCPSRDVPPGTEVVFTTYVYDRSQPPNSPPAPPAPAGTVTYLNRSGKALGSAPVADGVARWAATLALGEHDISSRYSGNGFYEGATSVGTVRLDVTNGYGPRSSPAPASAPTAFPGTARVAGTGAAPRAGGGAGTGGAEATRPEAARVVGGAPGANGGDPGVSVEGAVVESGGSVPGVSGESASGTAGVDERSPSMVPSGSRRPISWRWSMLALLLLGAVGANVALGAVRLRR